MFVHGDNINQKLMQPKLKYSGDIAQQYLKEIKEKYDVWRSNNLELKGPFSDTSNPEEDLRILTQRVEWFNEYKNFIDQQHYAETFDSRSNLHSSVLEEFIYYLFKDIATEYNEQALVGKSHAFKDVFFNADSYKEMLEAPHMKIETKDHDFVIGSNITAKFNVTGSDEVDIQTWHIPAVAIECKTYIDKTMLESSSTAAEQLKIKNPNALYIIVSERVKLSDTVNFQKYKVDQVYILRKQKNTDREYTYVTSYVRNPIFQDVIEHLFNSVRNHLTRGYLINK